MNQKIKIINALTIAPNIAFDNESGIQLEKQFPSPVVAFAPFGIAGEAKILTKFSTLNPLNFNRLGVYCIEIKTMNHIYQSTTGLTYCWYGDFYIRIRVVEVFSTYKESDYALIQTCQDVRTRQEYESLLELNALKELTHVQFVQLMKQAIQIIQKNASKLK